VTRALTKAETDVIVWLLRHDFPGAPELRAQVPLTRALGAWNEGSVSLNLAVAAEALPAVVPDGPVPGRAWAYNAKGLATGTVLLWVADGVLEAIDYGAARPGRQRSRRALTFDLRAVRIARSRPEQGGRAVASLPPAGAFPSVLRIWEVLASALVAPDHSWADGGPRRLVALVVLADTLPGPTGVRGQPRAGAGEESTRLDTAFMDVASSSRRALWQASDCLTAS
jgi:hypothetical protein